MEPLKQPNSYDVEETVGRLEWLLIAVAAVFLLFGTFTEGIIDNDRSRLASIQALVEDHTWVIEDSRFHKQRHGDNDIIDKVKIGDHFYSSKPPLFPFLMAGEYWVFHNVFQLDFENASQRKFLIWALTFTFTGIPFLWIGILFRMASKWFFRDPAVRLIGLAVILFGNEHLGFAQTINNHVPAASLLFSSMVFAIGLVHKKLPRTPFYFALTGVFAGLLPTVDLPGSFFCVPLWFYLFHACPKQTLIWFTVGAAPPLALHFALTYIISGGFLPFYLRKEWYAWDDSYWNLKRGLDAAGEYESKATYFFHLSVGRKGLFSLYPTMLLSVAYFFGVTSKWKVRPGRIAFLLCPTILLYYALIAWGENRDSNVSHYGSLAFYLLFALLPVALVVWMVRASGQSENEGENELATETVGMGALTLVWLVFYALKSDNYGGSATGFRWFMFFTPALQFFGFFTLAKMRSKWAWIVVCLLVGIAFYSGWQATVRPWSYNWDWPVRFLGKWYTR